MTLRSLRSLSSMRARMTAAFVFVLAPFLLIMSAILPQFAHRVTERQEEERFGWIAERVSKQLYEHNWQSRLDELVATGVLKQDHLVLVIHDRNGILLWRSSGPGPAWWPEAGAIWPKERDRTRPPIGSSDRFPYQSKRGRREGEPTPSANSLEYWRPETSKAPLPIDTRLKVVTKELAEARLMAEQKSAGTHLGPTGKSGVDWHVAGEFPVGPKDQRRVLVIFQSWSAMMQQETVQKLELLLLSLFALLGVAGGAWLLVGRTLTPIRRLAVQASVASVEDLHVRLKAPSRDVEVVDLVDTLNGLLERLAETAAAKGRFYAAASHELRTPLQALSGHLEVALSRERTGAEYEAFLEEAFRQTGRLTSLVKGVLLLHQLDTGYAAPREPVDLTEVCETALQQLAALAEARQLAVRARLATDAVILASPSHAEILVRNLVENAIKYAAPQGEVTLVLTTSGDGTRLEVFNECPPVPGWNPEKLFEPFYRPDTARNTRTGGNGLGLAICRAIAAANGWTVRLEQEARGVRATARFGVRPAAAPAAPKPRGPGQ